MMGAVWGLVKAAAAVRARRGTVALNAKGLDATPAFDNHAPSVP